MPGHQNIDAVKSISLKETLNSARRALTIQMHGAVLADGGSDRRKLSSHTKEKNGYPQSFYEIRFEDSLVCLHQMSAASLSSIPPSSPRSLSHIRCCAPKYPRRMSLLRPPANHTISQLMHVLYSKAYSPDSLLTPHAAPR